MEKSRQDEVIKALTEKGVNQPCPRCGNSNFEVVGESVVPINDKPGMLVIGGPAIPVVLVACNRCGYLTQHALGPLGLTKEPK